MIYWCEGRGRTYLAVSLWRKDILVCRKGRTYTLQSPSEGRIYLCEGRGRTYLAISL